MMRVATCEETKTNQWTISVLDVSPADLSLNGGGYTVRKGATVETVTSATSNGGAKNAKARTKRLATRNDAVVLTDADSIRAALEVQGVDVETSKSTKGAEVFNQADMFDAMDADDSDTGDDSDAGDDSDLDLDLLGLGWSVDQVSEMDADRKAHLVEGDLGPDDVKAAAPTEPDPPRRRRRRRRTRKPEDAPEVKAEDAAPEVKAEVKPKRKKRAAAPEAVTPEVKAAETEPPKRAPKRAPKKPADPNAPAAAPRGYVVRVSRDSWDKVEGEARAYGLGQTPDREEADVIAARWEDAGFTSTVTPLPSHHKARAGKRTVYTGDPVEPILCEHPGCAWAGDHLGPHLKSHDVTLDQYRDLHSYDGEAMVGRAAMALERAHKSVRRRNDLKVGMVVVRIEGDAKVEVWRVDSVNRAGKELTVAFVNRGQVDSPPEDRTIALSEFFSLFQPVGTWSKRLIRDTKRDWNGG